MNAPPLLEARGLCVNLGAPGGWWRPAAPNPVLRGVDLCLGRGERLAVLGESGSGKSTLIRALLRLVRPVAGQVLIDGTDLAILSPRELRAQRQRLALVFQDPVGSLNPALTVADIVGEPLRGRLAGGALRERVTGMLQDVELGPSFLGRRPGQLSGGQAQRVAIARALVAEPAALLCDEPVSALDMSLRAQVLALLDAQCRRRGVALLLVTHDLHAARLLCPRTLVLQRGQVVDQGPTRQLLEQPAHAYTRQLVDALLTVDPLRVRASVSRS